MRPPSRPRSATPSPPNGGGGSAGGQHCPAGRRVRVPHEGLCRLRRQEGRRVLSAALRRPDDGAPCQVRKLEVLVAETVPGEVLNKVTNLLKSFADEVNLID